MMCSIPAANLVLALHDAKDEIETMIGIKSGCAGIAAFQSRVAEPFYRKIALVLKILCPASAFFIPQNGQTHNRRMNMVKKVLNLSLSTIVENFQPKR